MGQFIMNKVQSKRTVHCKVTVRSKKGKKEGFLTGRVGAMKSASLMPAVILCCRAMASFSSNSAAISEPSDPLNSSSPMTNNEANNVKCHLIKQRGREQSQRREEILQSTKRDEQ